MPADVVEATLLTVISTPCARGNRNLLKLMSGPIIERITARGPRGLLEASRSRHAHAPPTDHGRGREARRLLAVDRVAGSERHSERAHRRGDAAAGARGGARDRVSGALAAPRRRGRDGRDRLRRRPAGDEPGGGGLGRRRARGGLGGRPDAADRLYALGPRG